jgi:hypothetical protein
MRLAGFTASRPLGALSSEEKRTLGKDPDERAERVGRKPEGKGIDSGDGGWVGDEGSPPSWEDDDGKRMPTPKSVRSSRTAASLTTPAQAHVTGWRELGRVGFPQDRWTTVDRVVFVVVEFRLNGRLLVVRSGPRVRRETLRTGLIA